MMNFHEIVELPWKKSFTSLMRYTFIEEMIKNGELESARFNFVLKHWERIKLLTLVDPFRMATLIELLNKTKLITGDIVECGSYKGGTGIITALWLKENQIDKKVYLLDSFEGLPDPDKINDSGYKKGQFKSNYENLKNLLIELGLENNIVILKGWFKDTIPLLPDNLKISFLHIDCDLYTSTNDCFPALYSSVCKGGAIVLDDYNDGGGGEKRAVEEFFSRNKIKETIELSAAPQSFIIKGEDYGNSSFVRLVNNQNYSHKYINEYSEYLLWLNKNFGIDLISQIKHINE